MQAPVFGRLCPPNSCSTTRIDPRDRLRPLHPVARLRRLRPWSPFRLVQLGLDHPVHLLVPADLGGPPPHWNSSKWFYWLNIPNTRTTATPFAKYICGSVIYSPPIIIRGFIHINIHIFKMFVASCLKNVFCGSANICIHASERTGSLKYDAYSSSSQSTRRM